MSDSPSQPIKLEHLMALNDEIAALVRAGVPLELGLRQIGETTNGALSRLSIRLAERMAAGASLREALDAEGDHLPGVYRAVVEAGLRSGRLPEALESVTDLARLMLDLQRRISVALVYPVLVVFVVWGLLMAFLELIVPRFIAVWEHLGFEPGWAVSLLAGMTEHFHLIVVVPPLVMIAIWLWLIVFSSQRGTSSGGRLMSGWLYRYAWYPGMVNNFDRAIFLKTLTLLLRNETTLHESLLLAGFASGNGKIVAGSTRAAERLQQGESLQASLESAPELPRFLRWMLISGEQHGKLEETLTLAGDVYFSRASTQADVLRTMLPSILTVVIGGGVTLLYALVLFAPVVELYGGLGAP